ncbi:integrating conjugative element protein [Gilliamella sp. wkB18]|uniref:TIGR03759 family integrating conjugative element protein n=1 Tax=Gilliamella sp. wkB18 TaxID=3120260 RepID=UPI00080DBF7E|nr:TIGR03759 family integrating conjugative element protein [Gilliamella apicola]OCG64100.1 integrating conjugative element protein [Gilliamella apicola]
MTLKLFKTLTILLVLIPLYQSQVMAKNMPLTDEKLTEQDTKNQNTDISLQKEETIKEKASFWGLTVEEWHKFEAINEKGGRGYWSPNLDPLTTLGVEAETQEERERYAMLLAKKEFERTTKELEFQRTYNQMFKRLYPDVLPVELDDNPNFVAPLNYEGERMVLFLDVNDSVRGANLLNKALKTGKEMDIYLLNTADDNALIQKWANINYVPIERVQTGSITLNHNKGQWEQIGKGISPILVQEQNDGKWRQIELGD